MSAVEQERSAPVRPVSTLGLDEARRGRLSLLALSAFVLAMLWIAIVAVLKQDGSNTQRQVEVNLSNLTRAFAEQTAKTLEGGDQAVRFVRSEFLAHGQEIDIPKYLSSQAIIDDAYHLLTVIGPDGYVVSSSQPFTKVDLHTREHFRVHAEGAKDILFVSKPVLGKVSGKWSIQLTRRIDDPNQRFAGVVVVSMSPDYFTRFFKDVDLGHQGAIALVGTDGILRARFSQAGQEQGQDIQASPLFKQMRAQRNGVAQMRSSVDGIERIYAFRTLEPYGLIVLCGIGVGDAMAEYAQRSDTAVVIGSLVSLVILLFTLSLLRRQRRQEQLVAELQASRIKAEAANQMKSKFLASVSHELRTPLNGILGYAELIRDTAEEPQAAEFGGIIHDSARHLHSLVNTILDLAKIESGHMVTTPASTELRPLLEETYRLHAVHAQARGLQFNLMVDTSCPSHIVTDRTRLLQVLGNIVNNAIKFTEQGEISLLAGLADDRLVILVRDSGIGMSTERLKQLFTRFQGAASELVHANQGAGLGLPLAKELIELLGGTLSVRSELGQGTEVCVGLPLEDSPHTARITP
jgi:two-component system sensor histidine kinase BarA